MARPPFSRPQGRPHARAGATVALVYSPLAHASAPRARARHRAAPLPLQRGGGGPARARARQHRFQNRPGGFGRPRTRAGATLAAPARAGPCWPTVSREAHDELHPEAAGAAARGGAVAEAASAAPTTGAASCRMLPT